MIIKRITIGGFRGFSDETTIELAIPDKKNEGSGLTVMVGPNNSGKSSVIEAVNLISSNAQLISKQTRNAKNDFVDIKIELENGDIRHIKSDQNRGALVSNCDRFESGQDLVTNDIFILSGKRSFSSTFSNPYPRQRNDYKGNVNEDYRREDINSNFGSRLIQISKNREAFNCCLNKVLDPVPDWAIEASDDSGSVYLEFNFNGIKHSSKGSGDGYINIFNIVDALYDSEEDNVIFIDEPEISLHPDLQKKLFSLLKEYSKDKQIIISTHSPYFIDWNTIVCTGKLLRFKKVDNNIKIYEMSGNTKNNLKRILNDKSNVHTLSLDSNDIFFLNDNIILAEGQEDVVGYKMLFDHYQFKSNASFFGWGMGGADKAPIILNALNDLGYSRVFTIFDNDRSSMVAECQKSFPNYMFYAIAAGDIRDKKDKDKDAIEILQLLDGENYVNNENFKIKIKKYINHQKPSKKGLIKSFSKFEINEEYEEDIQKLISEIQKYFSAENDDKESNDIKSDANKCPATNDIGSIWYDEYIENKCDKFTFEGGGGCFLSEKKINNIIYEYIEVGRNLAGNKKYEVVMVFRIARSQKTGKIKRIKRHIKSNTLPMNMIEKLFLNIKLKYNL